MSKQPHWYKEAIIYEVHVKCYADSSGDGIGDFKGLTEKLDYLHELGVTAIWLLPFYPSPLRDDGYDIANYQDVHPMYGVLTDFKTFLKEAHRRDLKVITELVINHTSDQHPWFQKARSSPKGSKWRDFYVWSDDPEKYKEARIIFQDFETSNWTWDPVAQSYYWHRFYSHQPDLNFENYEVKQAVFKALDFWLKMGVDGVRLDAIPYLFEREGTTCENLPETHKFLKELRAHLDNHFKDRMFLAEANQWPEEAAEYFGNGDECHMAFHFPVMPRLFMAIHLEDAMPIVEIMGQTPKIPENCQWALFLRNHDELTLEMVTDEERDYMFRVYAHDPKARINLGIRRRLAPLLKNDRRKIELMNSLLFSLIGTPVLYYGDEIGMGDNIYLGDRDGVRTPMQWSSDRNAGFSRANPQALYLPPIIDPEYHYETVNVEAQQNNPHSLYWWTRQLIALRKRFSAFGNGTTEFLVPENKKVLVFFRVYQGERILVVANLSRFSQYVELDLSDFAQHYFVELFSGGRFPAIGELPYFLSLGPYGYYWFSLHPETEKSAAERIQWERESRIETLTLKEEGTALFEKSHRKKLTDLLFRYLCQKGWFYPFIRSVDRTTLFIVDHFSLNSRHEHLLMLQVGFRNGSVKKFLFFLRVVKQEEAERLLTTEPQHVVAELRVPSQNKTLLYDCSEEPSLGSLIEKLMKEKKRIKGERGKLTGIVLEKNGKLPEDDERPLACTEIQSNVFPSRRGMLRVFTLVEEGMPLDISMRLHLAQTSFKQFFPVTAYLEYALYRQPSIALAEELASERIKHNAFNHTVEAVERFLLEVESLSADQKEEFSYPQNFWMEEPKDHLSESLHSALNGNLQESREFAKLLSGLHQGLSKPGKEEKYEPLPFTPFYQRSLFQTLRRTIDQGMKKMNQIRRTLPKHLHADLDFLLSQKGVLDSYLYRLFKGRVISNRILCHGNFWLEHLVFSGTDYKIGNFGGDPSKSYSEKIFKRSPLIDIVTLIFSLQLVPAYAIGRVLQRGQLAQERKLAMEAYGQVWSYWMQKECVDAYLDYSKGQAFLPKERKQTDLLLHLFLFEKGFEILNEGYQESEIRFEGVLKLLTKLARHLSLEIGDE
jgi:maltose alpha-D-glucosyltransferase / alpha-amylase